MKPKNIKAAICAAIALATIWIGSWGLGQLTQSDWQYGPTLITMWLVVCGAGSASIISFLEGQ